MLTFKIFDPEGSSPVVAINPLLVESVLEAERRYSYGGYAMVAVITMRSGSAFMVADAARTALYGIAKAQERLHGDTE
jgi:hypothetical protein